MLKIVKWIVTWKKYSATVIFSNLFSVFVNVAINTNVSEIFHTVGFPVKKSNTATFHEQFLSLS